MEKNNFYTEALLSLYPNCAWGWGHNDDEEYDYNDLDWFETDIPKPTFEEIKEKALHLEQEYKATEYQILRSPEYPPITDLADALYWNSKGDSSHLEEYYAACEEVKNKYPKPQ